MTELHLLCYIMKVLFSLTLTQCSDINGIDTFFFWLIFAQELGFAFPVINFVFFAFPFMSKLTLLVAMVLFYRLYYVLSQFLNTYSYCLLQSNSVSADVKVLIFSFILYNFAKYSQTLSSNCDIFSRVVERNISVHGVFRGVFTVPGAEALKVYH